jgi:hypothetical protein
LSEDPVEKASEPAQLISFLPGLRSETSLGGVTGLKLNIHDAEHDSCHVWEKMSRQKLP